MNNLTSTQYVKSATPIVFDSDYAGSAIMASRAAETVSNRYQFLSTQSLVDTFAQHGLYPYEYKQARVLKESWQGFQKHQVIFRSAPLCRSNSLESSGLVRNESYKLGVCVQNSHKADSSFMAFLHVEVCRCLNGLHVPELYGAFVMRHFGKGSSQSDLSNEIAKLISKQSEVCNQIDRMRSVSIGRADALQFASAAIAIRYPDEPTKINPVDLIQPIRHGDYSDQSLWLLFNNVQERMVRGQYRYQNARGTFIKARELSSLQTETRLNQDLWELADQFTN